MYSKSKPVFLLGIILSAVLMVTSGPSAAQNEEVLIKFKEDAKTTEIDSLTAVLGLKKVRSIKAIRVEVFEVPQNKPVSDVVKVCSNAAFVEYAEPSKQVGASTGAEAVHEAAPAAQNVPEGSAVGTHPEPEPVMAVQAETAEYKPGEILVKFKSTVSAQSVVQSLADAGIQAVKRFDAINVVSCTINSSKSVLEAVEECNESPDIEYAEPNYIYKASVIPNDSRFGELYGMTQIDGPEAWDVQKGSKAIIVGVIDTGVDTDHDDLTDNIWHNPGESGGGKENNKVDDDGNGYVDDYRGWDFINNDNNPYDDNQHGTHCSGVIGAVGNNNLGVVGVNWNVSIMPLKFLAGNGSGSTDDALDAIIYATDMGAKILSNSWGGGGRSQALEDAIKYANDHGVLFVAAAGNEFSNNDSAPTYPCNYEVPNVISVAANTSSDRLAGFSNFGKKTVDLSAPGSNIVSTIPQQRYAALSGTSMATPHVAGAAALMWAQFPSMSMNKLIVRLLGSVDRNVNYSDKVATGGRLNVAKGLSASPIIARTTRLDNTLDEAGPYVVESDIIDDSESTIKTATLTYQVTGQEAVTVNMTKTGDDHYKGEIPGQTLGSTIVYYVSATDDDDNLTKDSNFTFSIAEPTNGGGCCGRPPIEFAFGDSAIGTPVNALANIGLFMLPIVALRYTRKRNKK